ncbi:MAG TPA: IclR family transcriptional regulator [Selenomonadales bacterium]|nr:IclR family transcriptional regulator [Selenomonadales bacterium]
MAEQYLHSAEKLLTVMELLAGSDMELGVSDISRKLSMTTSTAHRLLITLEKRGYAEQNPKTGKYKPGMKIVSIGASILNNTNIIAVCRPFLEAVSQETGETTHLALYSLGEIIFVDKVSGSNPSKINSLVGQRRPAYSTATGKVWLAFMNPEELTRYLEQVQFHPYTPYTITDKESLTRIIEEIRHKGYGEDQQEADEGLVCLAAPIRDVSGKIVAAISVSGPGSRLNPKRLDYAEIIKQAAEHASRACGWNKELVWKYGKNTY